MAREVCYVWNKTKGKEKERKKDQRDLVRSIQRASPPIFILLVAAAAAAAAVTHVQRHLCFFDKHDRVKIGYASLFGKSLDEHSCLY